MKNNPEMLPLMEEKRIFYVSKLKSGNFQIAEGCDDYFTHELTPLELAKLGEELIELSGSNTQPSVQRGGEELRKFAETMLEVTSKYSMLHASAVRLGAELALGLEPTKVPHFAQPEPAISVNMFGSAEMLEELRAVAAAIHYPDCWDTATYPTLADAAKEIGCNPADCTRLTNTEKGSGDEQF